jgi:SAM-dependent methyltransferase
LATALGSALLWRRADENRQAAGSNERQSAIGVEQRGEISRLDLPLEIMSWHFLDGFPKEIAQFETVFWEPKDTVSLRAWMDECDWLPESRVLEIGTGTGLCAIACALRGADVLATDINPHAVANARYNAEIQGLTQKIECRLVDADNPGPFAVIDGEEKFDLIVSNPPWEDAKITSLASHALYDPGFALLDGILSHGQDYLKPAGRMLLAYGAKAAVERIIAEGPVHGWRVKVLDSRDLSSLPAVFLPGMLLELIPESEHAQQ